MINIVTAECTILILRKYGFKFCVILFCFYSINFKVYIYLPRINVHWRTTEPFDDTSVISSSDPQKRGIYQGSAYICEGDCNSDLICLIQKSQAIYCCNKSVLAIVPYLNILILSITIVDIISRSALVRFSLVRASFLYNLMGLRSYIFCLQLVSRLCDWHGHGWVHYIDTTKIWF